VKAKLKKTHTFIFKQKPHFKFQTKTTQFVFKQKTSNFFFQYAKGLTVA
jgi:hypothetical protein